MRIQIHVSENGVNRSLSSEGLEPQGELDGALDNFPVFDTLDVAFVRVLVSGADGDDPLGPGIFSFM